MLRELYNRLTSKGTTEERAIRGGIWVTGVNVIDRVLMLLKVLILARLLSPDAFGLLGLALLVIAAMNRLSELGFDQALIQHQDQNVDPYLNTAWVIKTVRGGAIAIIAFLSAPLCAAFFDEPQLQMIIPVLGLSPLVLGLQNPATVYFEKNLDFHKEFIYQLSGRIVDFVVAVTLAVQLRSVWALVLGLVSMNITKFIISYLIHEYRPRPEFDLAHGREMFRFGKWLFASSVLAFLYSQGDDAFVGWFFAAASLGFYQLAYRFSNAPATEITHIISRVAFPALSKVQDDVELLREGYLRAVQLSTFIAFPMSFGIIAISSQFVYGVLGAQWGPTVSLMQLLAVWGAVRSFGANVGAVFKSVGRPDYDVRLQVLKTLSIAVMIYPAADQFGVAGVALVVVGSSLVVQPVSVYLVSSTIDATVVDIGRLVVYPLLGSVVMYGCVWWVNTRVLSGTGFIELSVLVVVGMTVYAGFMLLAEKYTDYHAREFVNSLRKAV